MAWYQALPAMVGRGGDVLERPVHLPGVFRELVKGLSHEDFEERFRVEAATQGYGNVWYQSFEGTGTLDPTPRLVRACTLPLPDVLVETLADILHLFHHQAASAYQLELFWSTDPFATLSAHVDNDEVFTIQVFGRKLWKIDPVDLDWLCHETAVGRLKREGPWEAWIADNSRPTLEFARPAVVEMNPGDFLALPPFCLHQVWAISDGCNVSANASVCQEQVWEQYRGHRDR